MGESECEFRLYGCEWVRHRQEGLREKINESRALLTAFLGSLRQNQSKTLGGNPRMSHLGSLERRKRRRCQSIDCHRRKTTQFCPRGLGSPVQKWTPWEWFRAHLPTPSHHWMRAGPGSWHVNSLWPADRESPQADSAHGRNSVIYKTNRCAGFMGKGIHVLCYHCEWKRNPIFWRICFLKEYREMTFTM